jgi:hypothetical protein
VMRRRWLACPEWARKKHSESDDGDGDGDDRRHRHRLHGNVVERGVESGRKMNYDRR